MSKHTPGPWRVADGPTQTILAPSPSRRTGRYVQVIYFDGDNYKYQSPGDARLIAAAPDMLEALKALTWHPLVYVGCEDDEEFGALVVKARDAIDKAEGTT